MRLKFISNGMPYRTRVENAETGELVEGVRAFKLWSESDGVVHAELDIILPSVEISGEFDTVETMTLRQKRSETING